MHMTRSRIWQLMQYSSMLYNITLRIQCYTIQYNTIQYHAKTSDTMPCNTALHNNIQCNTIQYNAIQYSTTDCRAIRWNTMPFSRIHFNTIKHPAMLYRIQHDWTGEKLPTSDKESTTDNRKLNDGM